jgi:methylamine dehydrogenase light chain
MSNSIKGLDKFFERMSRRTAQKISRRHFLAAVGATLAGTTVLPVLPVSRRAHAADDAALQAAKDWAAAVEAQTKDDRACNYWRYCSIDGYLCSCCGGGPALCPAGSTPSPTSWIGSCVNPDDGKTYLMAYRDCCGKDSCARCPCLGTAGEMPVYRPQLNNDIIWCFGATSMVYHCSSGAIVGEV